MRAFTRRAVLAASVISLAASGIIAADWPQWRGPNRDARVSDFKVPQTWPKELTQKWKQPVGAGDSTPALVGDKLYVFARQDADEVISCLDASTGKPIWSEKYPAVAVSNAASQHPGPRASPAVADGKVVTLGVGGVVSCLDAQTGKLAWRKEATKEFTPAWPTFYSAMSPLIVDGKCIVHLGGGPKGAIIAYDLNSGEEKWRWDGDAPAYASPVAVDLDGTKQIVEMGDKMIVGLSAADGKLIWQTPVSGGAMPARAPAAAGGAPGGGPGGGGGGGGGGRGMRGGRGGGMGSNNAGTPIVDGQTLIVTGRGGTRALKIEKSGDSLSAAETWNNPEAGTSFNTPVLKDGLLYGISGNYTLFCIDEKSGKTLWTKPQTVTSGRGPSGFGSIVDAGSEMLELLPNGELTVFKPDGKEYSEIARIKVADSGTYAYPVLAGNRIYIRDQQSITAYTVE